MYQHTPSFTNHFGVDLKSSDLNRPEVYASYLLNAEYRASGSPNKRKGFQARGAHKGGYGQWTYEKKNPVTGADEKEVIKVDQNLFKMAGATLGISYAGAQLSVIVSIFLDVSTLTYRCTISDSTTTLLNHNLGIGFDEASPVTVTDLATLINALPSFTATVTGTGTTPAAFLKIVRAWDVVSSGAATLTARYFTQVNSTVSNPLATYYGHRNDLDFENVSAVQVQNAMYFGSGYDETMKYDGQTFYRAGLPTPLTTFASVLAAGAVTGNNYLHKMQYIQYDAAGNIVEGNLQTVSAALNPAAQGMSLTLPNVLAGSGFNTNCALVNGAQVAVNTITVTNSPHTMKVGDTAYFFDSISAAYVTRLVTAVTATTVVVAGAAVTVANGAVISNNLRIAVWRNKTSATTPGVWYEVIELPNNSLAATQTYVDNKADGVLGAQLIIPATDRSAPPKGKYISQWNGIMLIAGKLDDVNGLYISDVDSCEYFPSDTNPLPIESGAQDVITGIAPNNEVFTVHGNGSFTVISGDITTFQIRVETKTRDTGCVSHASIQELDGILVWLSAQGPRCSSGGQVPIPLGPASDQDTASRIDPEFDPSGLPDEEQFKLKRVIGFSDHTTKTYFLYCPAETFSGGLRYPNANSRIYAYDKSREAWLIWDSLNFAGGISRYGEELYFSERRYSVFETAVQSILYSRHNLDDAYDYADNNAAIDWDYSTAWYAFGNPSVRKKFEKLKIFAIEEMASNEFTITVKQEANFVKDVTRAEFDMSVAGGGGYGVSPYHSSSYGDPAEGTDEHPLCRDRIKSTRFRFQNSTIHENPIITGWQIQSVLPYKPKFTP